MKSKESITCINTDINVRPGMRTVIEGKSHLIKSVEGCTIEYEYVGFFRDRWIKISLKWSNAIKKITAFLTQKPKNDDNKRKNNRPESSASFKIEPSLKNHRVKNQQKKEEIW